jgi:RHS repeat-associated protein
MTQGGTTYYLAYDQVGSLRLITDNVGNSIKRVDYDSFGNIISDSNPSFAIPFAFAGGLHDPDTKLVRFGYRDYLPEIGKWTAKDPILFAGGDSNLFGYVQNDPVSWVDPWGLARIGRRPLQGDMPFNGKGPVHHAQIWYDDNGSNSGFFDDDKIRPDTGHTIDEYAFTNDPRNYNDNRMRKAELNVQKNMNKNWQLGLNDCQDYTDAVRNEYDRLWQEDIRTHGKSGHYK